MVSGRRKTGFIFVPMLPLLSLKAEVSNAIVDNALGGSPEKTEQES
jgi:hypothetical protein